MVVAESKGGLNRPKFCALLHNDHTETFHKQEDDQCSNHNSSTASLSSPRDSNSSTSTPTSGEGSPYLMSPSWSQPSPYSKSPWLIQSPIVNHNITGNHCLIGSIVREEGHVYSLAASGDLLYTGSDSKNIRVWRNMEEFSGFKSSSGLVKAIVLHGDKIFTGHQDGKIRIWKLSAKNPSAHKRIGSLPTFKECITKSVNPKNYVKARRNLNVLRIKHFDAISCLSLSVEQGLLYSGSWDKTLKVWRVSDCKCLESVTAHDDAINSVAVGFDSLVFTGSADGTVKVWKRELQGKGTNHFLVQTLFKQETAVTAVAVNQEAAIVYCGMSDGMVNFWQREKRLSHGGALRGHKMAILCLATAGNLVVSGSADKSICVWRREPGGVHTCLSVLTGHGGPVKCLAVEENHDGDYKDQRWIVYSGSVDKSVKVWRVRENIRYEPEWSEYDKYKSTSRVSYSSPTTNSVGRYRYG